MLLASLKGVDAAAEAEDAAGRVPACRGEALRCLKAGCSSGLLQLPFRVRDGGEDDAGPVDQSYMVLSVPLQVATLDECSQRLRKRAADDEMLGGM